MRNAGRCRKSASFGVHLRLNSVSFKFPFQCAFDRAVDDRGAHRVFHRFGKRVVIQIRWMQPGQHAPEVRLEKRPAEINLRFSRIDS